MSIVVDWGNAEDTFLIWRFDGAWTWKEVHSSFEVLHELSHDKADFDVMLDLRSCHSVQPNLLSHLVRLSGNMPHNLRRTVVISHSPFLERFYQMLKSYTSAALDVIMVTSIDAAYNLLLSDERHDQENGGDIHT